LMARLPQTAQLEKHEGAKAGARIREQLAERIQLLLYSYGRALLLFQAIAQQVKFVLEIRVGLFQTRTILKELHESLFVSAHTAPVRPPLEKTQLIDQCPAPNLSKTCGTPRGFYPLEVMPPLGTIFQPFV